MSRIQQPARTATSAELELGAGAADSPPGKHVASVGPVHYLSDPYRKSTEPLASMARPHGASHYFDNDCVLLSRERYLRIHQALHRAHLSARPTFEELVALSRRDRSGANALAYEVTNNGDVDYIGKIGGTALLLWSLCTCPREMSGILAATIEEEGIRPNHLRAAYKLFLFDRVAPIVRDSATLYTNARLVQVAQTMGFFTSGIFVPIAFDQDKIGYCEPYKGAQLALLYAVSSNIARLQYLNIPNDTTHRNGDPTIRRALFELAKEMAGRASCSRIIAPFEPL